MNGAKDLDRALAPVSILQGGRRMRLATWMGSLLAGAGGAPAHRASGDPGAGLRASGAAQRSAYTQPAGAIPDPLGPKGGRRFPKRPNATIALR